MQLGHKTIAVLVIALGGVIAGAYTIGRTLSNASPQYLGIAFSFGYGVWIFDDPVTWMALAGMVIIVAAGLAATLLWSRQAPADANLHANDP